MSKVYIISTYWLGPESEHSTPFLESHEIGAPDWEKCFSERVSRVFPGSHFYFSLKEEGECRVYAIRDLCCPNLLEEWMDGLHRLFTKEEDSEVIFLLHDRDILPNGEQKPHFYAWEHSGRVGNQFRHVYGFQHITEDVFAGLWSRNYDSALAFDRNASSVMDDVRSLGVLKKCIVTRNFPDEDDQHFLTAKHPEWESSGWIIRFNNDADGYAYQKVLHNLARKLEEEL